MRASNILPTGAFAVLLVVLVTGPPVFARAPDARAPVPAEPAVSAPPAVASAFERQLAERLALSRFDAEILWLDAAAGPFLTLHRPAEEPTPRGGLVISAAPGSMVDNAPVLRELARAAAVGGWSVVSLQPVAREAGPAATGARVTAALTYLVHLGVQNIVLVSDGGGARTTLTALAENASPALVGFVGLGAWQAELTGIEVAILDIAGARDPRALRWQRRRKAAARDYPNSLETVVIDGAGPDFRGYAEQTAKRVRGWLLRAAPARQLVTR